jgi:hypothetical protein
MCTLTVLRSGALLRVAVNRDESRQRPAAHPPFITRAGGLQVLTPQDPLGRGTWVAANSAGLVFALLNVHSEAGQPFRAANDLSTADDSRPSRGLIIPGLADCGSLDEAAWRLDGIPPDTFAPCRVIAAHEDELIDVALDGSREVNVHRIHQPLLFTSSSLGDALVEGPRQMLFEQMLGTPWDLPAQQDAFHAHRWRDRPAVSVHMSRPEACTVSTTVVEVTSREVRMIYQPAHSRVGTPVGLVIDLQQAGVDAAPRTRGQYAVV